MKPQCEVIFLPENKRIVVAKGTSLLQAARAGGLTLEAPCDGRGTCGKCRVMVTGDVRSPDSVEADKLGVALDAGIRLACSTTVQGDVRVALKADDGESFVALTAGQRRRWPVDPPACKRSRCRPGQSCFGVAVDIGTTGVVAELFNLDDGQSLGVRSCLNPQSEFGGDVLTRIAFASQQDGGVAILQQKIIGGVNRLIGELAAANKLRQEDICAVVTAGNTTMQHLLLGVNPRLLAQAPYRPVFTEQKEVAASEVGLCIAPAGVVTVLPSASAFVGADIVAGIFALDLHHYPKTALFIDIGTNGEIILSRAGLLVGTSSAAGPALEGMNISCGCRAQNGAIEGFLINDDGQPQIEVIGNAKPSGICGSGLIDLVAELVRCNVIEPSGRFARREKLASPLAERLAVIDGKPAFVVAEEGPVVLTQKDIRQVQLAKGAIAAAIKLLLKETAISYADIDEVLVAGAFGFHLRPSSLVRIGLLPEDRMEKTRFVGNTAKEGAIAALLNRQAEREIREIAKKIKIQELSLHPDFQSCYVKSLTFPVF